MMTDDRSSPTMCEPITVSIPLQDRGSKSRDSSRSRSSSTSTSSFEDINDKGDVTPRRLSEVSTQSHRSHKSELSRHSIQGLHEPATVDVGDIDDTETHESLTSSKMTSSVTKGPLAFKTTSLDDPQFYAQTGSLPSQIPRTTNPGKQRKNIDDRDPENVNDIVKIKFEEIFAEPEGAYSFGTIWGATFRVFTDTKTWCYKFLTALCGVPCALCWGLHFACLSFCQIWYYQPVIRSFSIQVRPCARMFAILIRSFIEPCFFAVGKTLSSIRINVSRSEIITDIL